MNSTSNVHGNNNDHNNDSNHNNDNNNNNPNHIICRQAVPRPAREGRRVGLPLVYGHQCHLHV